MRFSLIVPTLDRPAEVEAFMQGLDRQIFRDFEVILVDQSGTDLYEDIVARYSRKWPVKHVRSDVRKPRHACNLGARQAVGEIIAFPDDDCIYEPDTLERVNAYFRKTGDQGFITGAVLNLDGTPTAMGRWLKESQPLNRHSIWTGLIEFNFFMPRDLFEQVGGFDENLGPCTSFGSCEGPDLALRLMSVGAHGYHDRSLLVRHMDKSSTLSGSRAYDYGTGMGYVLRKNHASVRTVLTFFIRPLGGTLLSLLRRKRDWATYYFRTLQGRLAGYFSRQTCQIARHTLRENIS